MLFKYRSVEPWDFFLDILLNNRLYAARFNTLNDPMEGVFTCAAGTASHGFVEEMISSKATFGICSLSETHNNTLMWSYYAAAHQGVVLGLDVSEGRPGFLAKENIAYSQDNVFHGFEGSIAEYEARKVLCRKLDAWAHEREVRVFSTSEFVDVSLKQIYLGCLMPAARRMLVKSLVEKLCSGVEVLEMERELLGRDLRGDADRAANMSPPPIGAK